MLTKDRFPIGEYNKLSARKIRLVEIIEKINSNAYRLKFPSHIRTTDVFNVKHLVPFHGDSSSEDEDLPNLWSNSSQHREDDANRVASSHREDDANRVASSYLGRLEHPKQQKGLTLFGHNFHNRAL